MSGLFDNKHALRRHDPTWQIKCPFSMNRCFAKIWIFGTVSGYFCVHGASRGNTKKEILSKKSFLAYSLFFQKKSYYSPNRKRRSWGRRWEDGGNTTQLSACKVMSSVLDLKSVARPERHPNNPCISVCEEHRWIFIFHAASSDKLHCRQ